MKTKWIFLVIILFFAVVIFQGCIASLHPLYTDKDLVFDKRLLGTWHTSDRNESWTLENLMEKELAPYKDPKERKEKETFKSVFINKNSYALTYIQNGEKAEFLFNLVKLGTHYFVDLYPGELHEKNELLKNHYLPVHSYAKIQIDNNGFELNYLNTDLIYKLLNENKIRIKHESLEFENVITASTDELQKFVVKFADNKEFFNDPIKFKH
ncbi:hypothetical protein [[Flexibacter] sp. ATCC 35208]|uniref:hypothetical protein n=1 Tax=[Flexibacter] sp. ATCC 35208 TaxID=1936242 RepID=UPI0009D322AE|nr:hypothetical protein [[Flexibacter] sp. ATCC 35208]OMP78705.1 hypothetical protein BW716_13420 [[Flexibacter] sp. ATCC 35208]